MNYTIAEIDGAYMRALSPASHGIAVNMLACARIQRAEVDHDAVRSVAFLPWLAR